MSAGRSDVLERELSADDPLASFRVWYRAAEDAGLALPERVCLATASPDGAPSARMVLFKGLEGGRFQFFTDYRSRKARELDANPRAALVFYWHELNQQVRVEGAVERLGAEESDAYFLSRPRGSRLSACVSQQSAEIASRDALERRRAELEQQFRDREVTRPEHWGGYGLDPSRIEFWRHRDDRLHDRLVYRRSATGWSRARLQP
jgi:pyridoxamine 5'-phosphate oxidase